MLVHMELDLLYGFELETPFIPLYSDIAIIYPLIANLESSLRKPM